MCALLIFSSRIIYYDENTAGFIVKYRVLRINLFRLMIMKEFLIPKFGLAKHLTGLRIFLNYYQPILRPSKEPIISCRCLLCLSGVPCRDSQ